jgi:hypothetical protein
MDRFDFSPLFRSTIGFDRLTRFRLWRVACQFVSPAPAPSSSGLRRGHLDSGALQWLRRDIPAAGCHRISRCAQWCRSTSPDWQRRGVRPRYAPTETDRRKRATIQAV